MASPKFGAGFQRPVYRLKFQGPLAGLEVDTRSAPIAVFTELTMLTKDVQGQQHGDESLAMLEKLVSGFSPYLLAWNMTGDDDAPVPLNEFAGEGFEIVLAVVMGWLETISGVIEGSPLAGRSPSGGPSQEPPGTTEPSSPNPSS